MKNIKMNLLYVICLLGIITFAITSCKEDKSGIPEGKASPNPSAVKIRPDSASGGAVVILEGTNIFDVRTIVFDKNNVPASFTPTLNTDNSLVFRVPDTAFGGPQKINFTNGAGVSFSIPFKVIALPSVASATRYSFTGGEKIILTGNNLDDVSSVILETGGAAATIGPKTRKTLEITMPTTTAVSSKLKITNASGFIITTQEFINASQGFVFFRDNYENGEQDASWGDAGFVSNVEYVSGNASYGKNYQKGNWHLAGFGWNGVSRGPYNFLSFWMKGGAIDQNIYVGSDKSKNGTRAYNDYEKIVLPAKVWSYYKLDLNKLDLWSTGPSFSQLAFSIKGPDNADEKLYLDDVILIK
jgi:hypothetical protein